MPFTGIILLGSPRLTVLTAILGVWKNSLTETAIIWGGYVIYLVTMPSLCFPYISLDDATSRQLLIEWSTENDVPPLWKGLGIVNLGVFCYFAYEAAKQCYPLTGIDLFSPSGRYIGYPFLWHFSISNSWRRPYSVMVRVLDSHTTEPV